MKALKRNWNRLLCLGLALCTVSCFAALLRPSATESVRIFKAPVVEEIFSSASNAVIVPPSVNESAAAEEGEDLFFEKFLAAGGLFVCMCGMFAVPAAVAYFVERENRRRRQKRAEQQSFDSAFLSEERKNA